MIGYQGVDEMSQEQLVDFVRMHLLGRLVSLPLCNDQGPVPGMLYCPYPVQATVTALGDDLVYGLHVVVEAPGFHPCCFQLAWALEHLTVINE